MYFQNVGKHMWMCFKEHIEKYLFVYCMMSSCYEMPCCKKGLTKCYHVNFSVHGSCILRSCIYICTESICSLEYSFLWNMWNLRRDKKFTQNQMKILIRFLQLDIWSENRRWLIYSKRLTWYDKKLRGIWVLKKPCFLLTWNCWIADKNSAFGYLVHI